LPRGSLETSFCLSRSRSRNLWLGLGSVSKFPPRSWYRAHELVTFQGFVVLLVHLANKFRLMYCNVNDKHYYFTIYWCYFSDTFCFFRYFYFQVSVSICLVSASGMRPLPRFPLVPSIHCIGFASRPQKCLDYITVFQY